MSEEEQQANQSNGTVGKGDFAKWTLVFGFVVVGILGVAALLAVAFGQPPAARVTGVKDILSILLPVVSVWVGTVLAYYFGKENFEAAARNIPAAMKRLTPEQILASTPVTEAMISMAEATTLKLDSAASNLKLDKDILKAILDPKGFQRLPMVDASGVVKHIVHRSVMTDFLVEQAVQGKVVVADVTLGSMLADPKVTKTIDGFKTLGTTASLADAKTLIDKIDICQDVFVTEDGSRNTRALGWITNVLVAEKSRA